MGRYAQRHTKDTKYRGEALVQARESLFRELMANHFLEYFWKTLFLPNCARVSDLDMTDMMRFVMYDLLKRNFCKQPTPSALEAFVAGAVAKSFATGTTYPLQVAQSPRCIIYIFLHFFCILHSMPVSLTFGTCATPQMFCYGCHCFCVRTRQRIRHTNGASMGILDCLLEVIVVSGSLPSIAGRICFKNLHYSALY